MEVAIHSRFGNLCVEGAAPPAPDGNPRVTCRCSCGRLAVRTIADLRAGRAIACLRCQAASAPAPVESRSAIRPPLPRDEEAALDWLEQLRESRAATRRVLEQLDRAVVRYLEAKWGAADARVASQRREAQAAALRRLRFLGADDIARELGVGAGLSRAVVHQWVCRGRAVVLEALEHWAKRTRSPAVLTQIRHVRPLMQAGRADAGKARPWARKGGNS